LAKKYNKTEHQIVLRWAVQQGIAIIPKSSKPERIKENFEVTGWTIEENDVKDIDGLNKNRRFNDPAVFCELAFNTFFPIY
jgi:D-xylose reductase